MGRRAFTLVELIITIVVIAVLAVTAFLVVTKWISKSRDSSRLQDIAVIQQGLETEIVNTKIYPMPDNYTGVYDTGNALARYQGEFTDNVRNQIVSLSKLPKDPQGRSYGYSLSNDKKQYQLRAFLENTSYNDNYIDTASAATQISRINGNYNGFLVTRQSYSTGNVYSLWNIPTMFLWSGTVFSSGINYVNENNKPVDNTTNIRFADVSGLYDADSANNASILDGIVTTFSGSNGVSSQSLASLTMKTAAGGVSVGSVISVGTTGSCAITNGVGQKIWNGSQRGSCSIVSCNAGYQNINNACTDKLAKDQYCGQIRNSWPGDCGWSCQSYTQGIIGGTVIVFSYPRSHCGAYPSWASCQSQISSYCASKCYNGSGREVVINTWNGYNIGANYYCN